MDKCKHGLLVGTCAMCNGLIIPYGKLQLEWINYCDEVFEKTFKDTKHIPDQDIWFKNHRRSLLNKFNIKWKQKPFDPTWPVR